MMKKRMKYAGYCFLVVLIEVLIALYVHDQFIRPYIGDVLVVFAVYYFIKIMIPTGHPLLPVYVFVFAAGVEGLQYLNLVKWLGIENNPFLRTVLGAVFDWKDIACYGVGCGILMLFEWISHEKE